MPHRVHHGDFRRMSCRARASALNMTTEVAEPSLNRWETKAQRCAERLLEPPQEDKATGLWPNPIFYFLCQRLLSVALIFLSPTRRA